MRAVQLLETILVPPLGLVVVAITLDAAEVAVAIGIVVVGVLGLSLLEAQAKLSGTYHGTLPGCLTVNVKNMPDII